MGDVTWTHSTNVAPDDNSTLQRLAQSAIWLIYTTMIAMGWSVELSRLWTSANALTWGNSSTARSYVLLKSPVGFCPGPDGSGTGSQSCIYYCIECLGSSSTSYQNINLTIYATYSGGSDTAIPTGGDSINATSGVAFMPSSVASTKFSISKTSSNGFRFCISQVGSGIVYLHLCLLPLVDVMTSTATNLKYNYPVFLGLFYQNSVNNMGHFIFDPLNASQNGGVGFGKILNENGTPGVVEIYVLSRYLYTTGASKVIGFGASAGNCKGDQIDAEIFVYNSSGGSVGCVGRVPDYLINANNLGSGSTFPKTGTKTHCVVGSLLIPSDDTLVA